MLDAVTEERSIRDFLPKPSDAVQAMVDGLVTTKRWKTFRVHMSVFGTSISSGVCFGCAATCTVMRATGIRYRPDGIGSAWLRARHQNIRLCDLLYFEFAIDRLRAGITDGLFVYYGVSLPNPVKRLPVLSTRSWRRGLRPYRAYARQLKAEGL